MSTSIFFNASIACISISLLSIFKLGITTNIYSICAFLVGVLLLSTVLFIPPLKIVFNVVSLSGNQYLLLIFCAIMPTVIIQLLKIIVSYKK